MTVIVVATAVHYEFERDRDRERVKERERIRKIIKNKSSRFPLLSAFKHMFAYVAYVARTY